MYKVDLHTHSVASPDGGITAQQYINVLENNILDCIAITDHNRIDFAQELQQQLGSKIIIGEEIMTSIGEIIGLFLTAPITKHLSPIETIQEIHDQDGVVYIPHPLKPLRHGLPIYVLDELTDRIDVVEVGNGRSLLQQRYTQILVWSNLNHLAIAASSDAHGIGGLGRTYTMIEKMPTKYNLKRLLSKGSPNITRPSLRALLYPKYNRLKNIYK